MADEVSPHNHATVKFDGDDAGLLFKSISAPSVSLDVAAYPTFDANGNPVNSLGGGTQVTYGDLTIERAVDPDNYLGKWLMDVKGQGAVDATKKVITITINTPDNNPIRTVTLNGCVITSHGVAAVDAQSGAVLTESVTIKVTEVVYD